MAYPGRPYPEVLPQFVGTAGVCQTPEQRAMLLAHVTLRYVEDGASLRELAAETGRTQTAIRRALSQADVPIRGRGAPRVDPD